MSRFVVTVAGVVLSAVLIFAAQATEYAGLEYMTLAVGFAVAALVGTLITLGLTAAVFSNSSTASLLALALLFAAGPFAVDLTLRANQTQLNVHGLAMLGFLVYAALSELAFLFIIAAVVVRAARRARSHP